VRTLTSERCGSPTIDYLINLELDVGALSLEMTSTHLGNAVWRSVGELLQNQGFGLASTAWANHQGAMTVAMTESLTLPSWSTPSLGWRRSDSSASASSASSMDQTTPPWRNHPQRRHALGPGGVHRVSGPGFCCSRHSPSHYAAELSDGNAGRSECGLIRFPGHPCPGEMNTASFETRFWRVQDGIVNKQKIRSRLSADLEDECPASGPWRCGHRATANITASWFGALRQDFLRRATEQVELRPASRRFR